ncbi:hypothetical protein PIS_128 [Saccharomonospora phage PIS 136]|nr:hypothetical protein PIS_128 [Saccharomonospora phage PIS 136]
MPSPTSQVTTLAHHAVTTVRTSAVTLSVTSSTPPHRSTSFTCSRGSPERERAARLGPVLTGFGVPVVGERQRDRRVLDALALLWDPHGHRAHTANAGLGEVVSHPVGVRVVVPARPLPRRGRVLRADPADAWVRGPPGREVDDHEGLVLRDGHPVDAVAWFELEHLGFPLCVVVFGRGSTPTTAAADHTVAVEQFPQLRERAPVRVAVDRCTARDAC